MIEVLIRRWERVKAQVRARVEDPVPVLKNLFHHRKTPYRGLAPPPPSFTVFSPLPTASWPTVRSSTPPEHERTPNPLETHGAGRKSPIRRPADRTADRLFYEEKSAVAPMIFKNQSGKSPPWFRGRFMERFLRSSLSAAHPILPVSGGAGSGTLRKPIL